MNEAVVVAVALVVAGGFYIRLRWSRSPQAYRAMVAIAAGYFAAGLFVGAWALHPAAPKHAEAVAQTASANAPARPAAEVGAAAGVALAGLSRFSAKIVSITDGDTVDVLSQGDLTYAVRLEGIDASEHDQPFGSQSTEHLTEILSGKNVTLECENERSYGRLICRILLPNREDACLDQVKAGMAWHYKQYEDEQSPDDRASYAAAECTAMKAKIGFWSEPNPEQRQDFRHGTRSPLLLDANGCRTSSEPVSGAVVGNARSHIFEWPACPYFSSISPDNRVPFSSPQAAEAAGYRPAHNCP